MLTNTNIMNGAVCRRHPRRDDVIVITFLAFLPPVSQLGGCGSRTQWLPTHPLGSPLDYVRGLLKVWIKERESTKWGSIYLDVDIFKAIGLFYKAEMCHQNVNAIEPLTLPLTLGGGRVQQGFYALLTALAHSNLRLGLLVPVCIFFVFMKWKNKQWWNWNAFLGVDLNYL